MAVRQSTQSLIPHIAAARDGQHNRRRGARHHRQRCVSCSVPTNQALATSPIEIGDDVWIETKATILKGVNVGERAVIATNAVVTGPIDPFAIVGGIPASLNAWRNRSEKQ